MSPARTYALTLAALVVAVACGHKGPPVPPLRRTPPSLGDFGLAQRGEALEVSLTAPRASVDGVALKRLEIEILWGEGQIDLEKAGQRRTIRADAGARVVESLPLPPPGTLVRAAARASAGGAEGQRTVIRSLEVQPPLSPPRELDAELRKDGVALDWQGEMPEPVEPPELGTAEAVRRLFGVQPEKGSSAEEGEEAPASPPEAPDEESDVAEAPASPPEAPDEESDVAEESPDAESAEGLPPEPRTHGFSVYRRIPPGLYGRPLSPEPQEERTFTDHTAPLGAHVCYVVRAVASVNPVIESASSNEACLDVRDIVAPSAPTGLAVVPRGGGLEIVWTPSREGDLSGYRIYRAVGDARAELVAEVEAGTTSWTDTEAAPVVLYHYTVTAVDKAGNESPPSHEAGGRRP
jgi:hypothetical protein